MKYLILSAFSLACLDCLSAFCDSARQGIEQGAQSVGKSVHDQASCLNFCEQVTDPECPSVCGTCYQEQQVSADETGEDGSYMDPRATKTERDLIMFVQRHGKKEVSSNGTVTFQLQDMSKELSKRARFSSKVRSIDANPHGCGIKLNELDGTPMELLGTGATGKSKKLCKKLKVGKKLSVAPRSITYVFMKYNPFRKMSNQGLLIVFP